MSIQAMSWVMAYSEARLGDRLVLLAIANHANAAGTAAWPSINTIADEARLSGRQVKRAVQRLHDAGDLIIEAVAGPNGVHRYHIQMGDRMSPLASDNLSPVSPDGVTGCHLGGDKSYTNPVRNVTQTLLEPSFKKKSPTGDSSENGKRRSSDVASEMTEIWNEECSFARANKPNRLRVAKLAGRWRDSFERNADTFREFCRRIAAAPHLRGENDRAWRADLDWTLEPRNLSRIVEGRYDPRAPPASANAPSKPPQLTPEQQALADELLAEKAQKHG